MTHYLKISPYYINEVIEGNKTFEVRKNDRNFQVGDVIILQEYHNSKYLERKISAKITYILDRFEGVPSGYVVLGIKILENSSYDEVKIREQIEVINREIKENVIEVKVLERRREILFETREMLESLLD